MRSARGERLAYADAQRRLAAVYELKGEREAAFAARRVAADAFAAAGRPADAAVERLAMANHRRVGAGYGDASSSRSPPPSCAEAAQRPRPARAGARARGRGAGQARRVRGRPRDGPRGPRAGARARPHRGRRRALPAPRRSCSTTRPTTGAPRRRSTPRSGSAGSTATAGTETACVTCLVYVLRERGEWPRAAEIVPRADRRRHRGLGGRGLLGVIHAFQGKFGSARRMLALVAGHLDAGSATTTWRSTRRRASPTSPPPRAPTTRPPSTAARCSSAGSAPRTTTTRSGACAGRPASWRAAATARARTPAPRR